MPVKAAVLFFLMFFVCFVLGFIFRKKKAGKWIFFSLSAIGLIGTLSVCSFYNWDLGNGFQTQNKASEVSKDNKQSDHRKNEQTKPNKEDSTKPAQESSPPEQTVTPVPSEPEKMIIPDNGSVNYKVVSGDNLWSIAQRAGTTVEKIKQWNGLTSDTINTGQVLKLYGKNAEPPSPAAPPTTEASSGAASVITYHGNVMKKEIALTFDAGSDIAGITILDVLKKHNVKATFFLTGKWAEKFPAYAKRIADEGHEIGNHSYSHPDPVKISTESLKVEISKAEQAIRTAAGKTPRPYFRFPYGSYNAAALKAAGEAGYPLSIQWSLDTIDWQQPTADTIVSRIEAGASNGDIILMHIGGINTPQAVDRVIPELQSQGYKLVTLSELLN